MRIGGSSKIARTAEGKLEAHISNYGRVVEQATVPDAKEALANDQPLDEPLSSADDEEQQSNLARAPGAEERTTNRVRTFQKAHQPATTSR
jgi:hypothetical protein